MTLAAVLSGIAGAATLHVIKNIKGLKGASTGISPSSPAQRDGDAAAVDSRKEFFSGDALSVDEKDKKTPDDWVRRHPNLVRLTGRHPFNCEPPLEDLKNGGWLTPAPLHYVRNHGAVPVQYRTPDERQDVWDSWRVKVNGLVSKELDLSMNEICSMTPRQISVLLVCAGNRRKEQNQIKKTIGFSWGAAGLANNVWTGVRLCDVLAKAGVTSALGRGLHVCFTGPKGELPKGDDGTYGTSVPLEKALDPACDIMVAYRQNGQLLEPDHGFPVRIIIPGYIGGRMIKWLTEITVTDKPSDNFYHYKDNRVLPVGVTPESAEAEGWWFKPDYIINQLNINSAMWSPAHNETKILDAGVSAEDTYELGGYAYAGNGEKVIRVEISTNNGKTWTLADIVKQGEPTEYGKYWSWCFWSYRVPVQELIGCDEVMVRAWDACMNTQPKDPTWNVMGMLNNPWYRVRVHKLLDPSGANSIVGLRFQHPTRPANQTGGWMDQEDAGWRKTETGALFGLLGQPQGDAGALPTNSLSAQTLPRVQSFTLQESGEGNPLPTGLLPAAPPAKEPAATAVAELPSHKVIPAAELAGLRRIPMEEVEKHDTEEDCWIVVNDVVYDVTGYLEKHPGGASSITMYAGQDATVEFDEIHSPNAWRILKDWRIGVLSGSSAAAAPAPAAPGAGSLPSDPAAELAPALNRKKKTTVTLAETTVVANDGENDVLFMRFALPHPQQRLGLPTGQHFMLYANVNGKTCARAYTPISNDGQLGAVDMVIKVYNTPGKEGKMSSHLGRMKVGDTMEIKGPLGEVTYTRAGCFKVGKTEHNVRHVAMIAGGTGITPHFQVIQTALLSPEDTTCFHLLYANRTHEGIMLQETLDKWAADYPNRFSIRYVVERPPENLKRDYSIGYITKEMIDEYLCKPSNGPDGVDMVFMCGPKPMIEYACLPNLKELGIPESKYVEF